MQYICSTIGYKLAVKVKQAVYEKQYLFYAGRG